MAFSNEDKKKLNLMIEEPAEFLKFYQSHPNLLNNLKNEFFKDGTGIFHLLIENIFMNNQDPIKVNEYKNITTYLLNNKFNLFQKSGRKETAFDILNSNNINNSSYSAQDISFIFDAISLNAQTNIDFNSYSIFTFFKKINFANLENIKNTSLFLNKNPSFFDHHFIDSISIAIFNSINVKNNIIEIFEHIPQLSTNVHFLKNYIKFSLISPNTDENIKFLTPLIENDKTYQFLDNNIGTWTFLNGKNIMIPLETNNIYIHLLILEKIEVLDFLNQNLSHKSFNGLLIHDFENYVKKLPNPRHNLGLSLLTFENSNKKLKYELLFDLFTQTSDEEQVNWLVSGANNHIINNISNRYTKHFKNLATESYNYKKEESYNLITFILKKVPQYFANENISHTSKLALFKQLLYFNKEINIESNTLLDRNNIYDNRFQTILKIYNSINDKNIPSIVNGFGSSYSAFYSICLSIPKSGLHDEKEINAFCSLYEGLKKHGHEDYNSYLYSEGFFNSPKLIKQLFDKGFNLEKIPKLFASNLNTNENNTTIMYSNVNPYLAFLPLKVDVQNESNIKNITESFQIINEHHPIFLEKDDSSFFSSILHANNYIINSFLPEEKLLNILPKDYKFYDISLNFHKYNLNPIDQKSYSCLIEKLINVAHPILVSSEFHIAPFFQLIPHFNENTLNKFIKTYNFDLNSAQENVVFWLNLKFSDNLSIFEKYITKPLPENKVHSILYSFLDDNFLNVLDMFLNKYPEHINHHYSSNENCLHIACKNFEPEIINYLIDKAPNLSQEINDSKNLPLTYFFSSIVKQSKSNNKVKDIDLQKNWNLFEKLIQTTFNNPNSKFKDKYLVKMQELLNKDRIKELFPKLEQTLLYYSLNHSIDSTTNASKIRKNKI